MRQTNRPYTTTCPSCSARYYLCRTNVGHRTVCQKCGANFHMLPASEEAPTTVVTLAAPTDNDISLIGRRWLDLRPGQIVAEKYKVTRFLGRGGLSQVFQVLDLSGSRYLGLKVPLAATLDRLSPMALADEARAWLKPAPHPNLVTCEGVLILINNPAIVMEYIDGLDLSRLMDDGRGPLYQGRPASASARLLDVFIQVARGLKYAHGLGLTHLDIKPRNILVEKGGRAVIGDYGPLCRNPNAQPAIPADCQPADRPAPADDGAKASVTHLMGTHQYFSPEVVMGLSGSGINADLWALTLTILECFLGRRPWEMGSMAGRALEHYLSEFRPLVIVSPPLADFFRKALAEKPKNRHQSAAELEKELISVYKVATNRPYLRPESVLEAESHKRMQMKELALKALGSVR